MARRSFRKSARVLFHAAALLWVAGVGHLIVGDVDLHATAWLLTGSVPGILISSRYTVKVPDLAYLCIGLAPEPVDPSPNSHM